MNVKILNNKNIISKLELLKDITKKQKLERILQNIKIVVSDKVYFTAYGKANQIKFELDGIIKEEGEAVVNGEKFYNIFKTLGESPITLTKEDQNLVIKSNNTKYVLYTAIADNFPKINNYKYKNSFIFNKFYLEDFINKVKFMCLKNSDHWFFDCIHFNFNDFESVGTDGTGLAIFRPKIDEKNKDQHILNIPIYTIELIQKIIKTSDTNYFTFSYNDKHILIEINNIKLYSNLYNDDYPNYNKVLPKTYDIEFNINIEELSKIIKRVGIMGEENSIFLDFYKDYINFLGRNMSGEVEIKYNIEYKQFKKVTLALNYTRLLQILDKLKVDEVNVKILDESSPIMFSKNEQIYILMPMRY